MKNDFAQLETWTPKKIRTLRNNLNNRIESFKKDGEGTKELQKSHMLFGLDAGECRELLTRAQKIIKETK